MSSLDKRPTRAGGVNDVHLPDGTVVPWEKAFPRRYWTSEFWAACRPEHEEQSDGAS